MSSQGAALINGSDLPCDLYMPLQKYCPSQSQTHGTFGKLGKFEKQVWDIWDTWNFWATLDT